MNALPNLQLSSFSRRSSFSRAFTFVEILIAVGVLTVMSAVALQSFMMIYRRSVDNRTTTNAYAILENQIAAALNDPYTLTSTLPTSLTPLSTATQIYPNSTVTVNTFYSTPPIMGTFIRTVTPINSGVYANLGLLQVDVLISCTNSSGIVQTFEMRTVRSPDL